MKHIHFFTLLPALVFCTFCKAQNTLLKESTTAELKAIPNGPKGLVNTIKQDSNGNIWLAAAKGIFMYDGKTFTKINNKKSSGRFSSVLEDKKGNFWFSTMGAGVYYYDGKAFKNFTINEGLSGNNVTSIYEDKTGNVWFGTESGTSRYDGSSFRNFKMKEGLSESTAPSDSGHISDFENQVWMHNDINAIAEDKTGKLWFATKAATYVYDGKTFTLAHGSPTFTKMRAVIEDKKGYVWLGGSNGLWRYNGSRFTNFGYNIIGYIYEDKKGNIWTSSEDKKTHKWVLSRYDEKSLNDPKPVPTEVKSTNKGDKGMLYGILEANDGNVWVGTGDGVYRYDENANTYLK